MKEGWCRSLITPRILKWSVITFSSGGQSVVQSIVITHTSEYQLTQILPLCIGLIPAQHQPYSGLNNVGNYLCQLVYADYNHSEVGALQQV